ncbi:DUF305 domain-containing protein [Hymenobacter guriensis]|uniref:DUF305 domain-containing protein n=1 Tax=Hymenobacter guriensis TaxID=2793065 RepID=A0ABS0L872_9BACT|nr:DUF305 domain-containing protein [Hymenobacter guriensis]MBG8555718.1 DUF305 domain-containing protein [Hymenobacter guriensis]
MSVFKFAAALLFLGLLLSGCGRKTDDGQDAHMAQVPSTMMQALHTMDAHSQALPRTDNLDVYFARLMRENHQAAVSMSALELQHGRDATLRALARDIHQAHQRLIPGLDSAIERMLSQPPTYPEHTSQSHQLAELLEAATKGLHPAAHRSIAGDTARAPAQVEEQRQDAGTGDIDRDYASLLIPHHENSITLARAELELGRDEALRKVAYLILLDQQREINQVRAWLRQHPGKAR